MSTETNVAKQEREKLKLEIQRQKEKLLKLETEKKLILGDSKPFKDSRTKSAEDKILKKRQKIAELKDKLSEYEKSLEDYVEIGVKAVDNLNTFVRKISGVDFKEKLSSKLSQ